MCMRGRAMKSEPQNQLVSEFQTIPRSCCICVMCKYTVSCVRWPWPCSWQKMHRNYYWYFLSFFVAMSNNGWKWYTHELQPCWMSVPYFDEAYVLWAGDHVYSFSTKILFTNMGPCFFRILGKTILHLCGQYDKE